MTNKQKTLEVRKWEAVLRFFEEHFTEGQTVDINVMIYLIGARELGRGYKKFKKREKVDLMHIAVCRLLEPYGFYAFDFFDKDGWPHYRLLEVLPGLRAGEQTIVIKKAILQYFEEEGILSDEFQKLEEIIV